MELDVALNNVVCSFGLGRGLELALLVQKGVNIEMKVATPNRCSCLLISLYHPKGQTLFFNFFMLKCFIGS